MSIIPPTLLHRAFHHRPDGLPLLVDTLGQLDIELYMGFLDKTTSTKYTVFYIFFGKFGLQSTLLSLNLWRISRVYDELLFKRLHRITSRDEDLCLRLVLNTAVSAAIQTVGQVMGKLVLKLVNMFARNYPPGILVTSVRGEDFKILINNILKLCK
jgi:hypothetical protein